MITSSNRDTDQIFAEIKQLLDLAFYQRWKKVSEKVSKTAYVVQK